jgi:uncharacterized protein
VASYRYHLGLLFLDGLGVLKDATKAIHWLTKSDTDDVWPWASVKLGEIYEAGEIVPKNDAMALQCYRSAAKRGLQSAQLKVGKMYAEGRGVGSRR